MSHSAKALPDLGLAMRMANQTLSSKGYTVTCTYDKTKPKEPVYLQLTTLKGDQRSIGITHLVHLEGKEWDKQPFEASARTTEEVAQAILARVDLFLSAEKRALYVGNNGTIFDFDGLAERHENDTFSVAGKVVKFKGKPLLLAKLFSEGIIEFRHLEDGHIELFDSIDLREGKGMFIGEDGELYRA